MPTPIAVPGTNQNYLPGDPSSFTWGQGDWQGTGGGDKAQQYYAFKKFAELFGRNPTQSELDRFAPAYASGDPNKANVTGGNSVVASYYDNQTNTPEKQAADQQAKYQADAPKFYDQINGQFQSSLGRDATKEEKDHFGSLLASGQVDPYTVGNFLSQLPEAVTKQDASFRDSLRSDMSKQDARYFNEQLLPGIQQNFAKSGRSFDSSGFANAAVQAGQQQNTARESYLTNLTAGQYAGNKTNAYNDYLNNVGRLQAGQDYSRNRTDLLADQTTGRINEIQNYAMQKQAYDQYLSRYGKRSSPFAGAAQGALSGGMTGGMAGGGWGAGIGAALGGLLGGFGSQG